MTERRPFLSNIQEGDVEDVANYRLVRLTSVVCKVIERISKRIILLFLIQCQSSTGCQHGIPSLHSCLSNLLILGETITRKMDEGNTADVAYLDFANVFDAVPICKT